MRSRPSFREFGALNDRKTKENDDFLEKRGEIQEIYLTSSIIIGNLINFLTNWPFTNKSKQIVGDSFSYAIRQDWNKPKSYQPISLTN